jgi:hypothetical protein
MKVRLTLSIGLRQSRSAVIDVEAPDDWAEMSDGERRKFLDDTWEDWAWSHIDGSCEVLEAETNGDE